MSDHPDTAQPTPSTSKPEFRQALEQARADVMRQALERIERWFGEFPETGQTWDDGSPMGYGAVYGSNGERDYMRSVARAALTPIAAVVDK
jgi:hypothetical protein